MASNTELNLGSGGDDIVTKERDHDGDLGVKQQIVGISGVSGTEGSYVWIDIDGGNGVAANALRVTLASDSTGRVFVAGPDVEDAAVTDNPLLGGGRYDASARTLDTGDVGAIALNASGHVICDVSASTGGTHVDDAAFTVGTDDGVPVFAIFDDTGTDSVDEGDAGILRMTGDRKLLTVPQVHTAGGTTFFHSDDLDETEEEIKGTAGQIYFITCFNVSAALLYLQVFNNTAAAVTVGTTAPDMVFPIPTQGTTDGAGFVLSIPNGIEMSTGITVAATTTPTGNTGPGLNEVLINVGYA